MLLMTPIPPSCFISEAPELSLSLGSPKACRRRLAIPAARSKTPQQNQSPGDHLSEEPSQAALDVLRRVFGFASFRGQQQAIVEHVVAGGDAIVLMPTGG